YYRDGEEGSYDARIGKSVTVDSEGILAEQRRNTELANQLSQHLASPPIEIESRVQGRPVTPVDCVRSPELYKLLQEAEAQGIKLVLAGEQKFLDGIVFQYRFVKSGPPEEALGRSINLSRFGRDFYEERDQAFL